MSLMTMCANCNSHILDDKDIVLSVNSNKPMHKNCISTCVKCGEPITDKESLSNQFKCNGCNPKVEGQGDDLPTTIRRSHIELYRKCPHAFYLEVIKKVPTENNIYALHGIILHDMFDFYSNHPEKNKEDMYEEFKEKYFKEIPSNHFDLIGNDTLYMEMFNKGNLAIKGYIEYEKTAPRPWKTEEKIEFSIADDLPTINITMDRINKVGEDLHFIDYKCGETFSGMKLSTDLQVPLYCLASKHAYGQLPKSFTFVFVRDGKTRYYELKGDNTYVCKVRNREYVVNITEAIREVKQVFSMIKKRNFNIPPTILAYNCKICYYGKKEICKGKDTQRWLQTN